MSAEIHFLPPRYRIAFSDGDRQGIVEDQATGMDWDTRDINEAVETLEQLKAQFSALIFWVTSGG